MEGVTRTPIEKELSNYSWRQRLVVGAHAVSLVVGGVLLMENTVEVIREDQSVTVEVLPGSEAYEIYPNTAWIMVPGYNMAWRDSREAAEALLPELEKTGQVHWAGYANDGFRVEDIQEAVLQHAIDNDLTTINLYGYSFGGMVSVEVAKHLTRHGIAVERIILDSTPADTDDVTGSRAAMQFISAGGLGAFTRAAVGVATVEGAQPFDFLLGNATKYASADLLEDTTAYILGFSLDQATEGLSSDITISYIGSANDERIATTQAAAKWQLSFNKNAFETYDSFPAGHASPKGDPKVYLNIISQINSRMTSDMCRENSPSDITAIEELCPVMSAEDPLRQQAV